MPASLTIWAVSDGRAGIEAQAVGMAEAVARQTPAKIVLKRVAWRGAYGRSPWWAQLGPRRFLTDPAAFAPPWPDLWIGCGRASLPLSMRVRRWSEGRTFVVQLQDPRTPLGAYDLVIPPRHDGLKGPNVFPILGAPQRVTPQRLAAAGAEFAPLLAPLPRPRVAVLIGGKSKAYDLPAGRGAALADRIAEAVRAAGGSIMATFSRRTPGEARAAMAKAWRDVPGLVWDGSGANPYFGFLDAADVILVTEESANMATEAAATGKPVYLLSLPGRPGKFARFHDDLIGAGIARRFDGELERWTYAPLVETDRAAAEILRRMRARTPV